VGENSKIEWTDHTRAIPISQLHAHPKNPRFAPREDVVEQIASQITAAGEFDQAHALIVRKNASGYEIISGHHRALAAEKSGLKSVPCWVREMSDEDAYMALALNNAQGELHPLEEGVHALGSGLDIKAFAEIAGKPRTSVQDRVKAARVVVVTGTRHDGVRQNWSGIGELHAAPQWLWKALIARLLDDDWNYETARREAQRFKDVSEPPTWANAEAISEALVSGELKMSDLKRFASRVEQAEGILKRGVDGADRLMAELHGRLGKKKPSRLSDVEAICIEIEQEQAELIKQRQQKDLLRTKREEEIAARTARLRGNVSLEEWKHLAADERAALLAEPPDGEDPGSFVKQETDDIEWAQWSWNPVTGCEHNCPYCYARDITENPQRAKVFPNGFAPTFRPAKVFTPRRMKVPKEAKEDTRSMADLPQWNFLCLTKFPKRIAEFDIPDNAWMGTTVDLQARVASAEAAFAKVNTGVKWLSVEP
jgi:hypothetical protein